MKKIFYLFLLFLISNCKITQNEIETNNPNEINPSEIIIETNKNIETIGIILILSDLGDYVLEKYNGNYALINIYRKEFRKFKNHPAVLKVNELNKKDLLHFAYYYYGLTFSQLPEFKQLYPRYNEFYISKKLSKEQIELELTEFDKLIRKFWYDAHLKEFFNKNAFLYSKINKEIENSLPKNIISTMEKYFKNYKNEYIIVPSSTLFTGFNFGTDLKINDKTKFYYVTGPANGMKPQRNSLNQIKPTDSLGFNDLEYYTDLAIHEFGHSFVRFLDKENNKNLWKSLSYLNNDKLKKNFKKIGEGTEWSTIFEEHLVRANEIMIWREMGETEIADEKLKYEYNKEGILYIREFVKSLEKYRINKNKYENFEEYFPKLIEDLKKIKNE